MKITAQHVEILLAISSLVVAVASLRVAKTQEIIVKSQFDAQKEEHQPVFFVEKFTANHDSTECFRIIKGTGGQVNVPQQ